MRAPQLPVGLVAWGSGLAGVQPGTEREHFGTKEVGNVSLPVPQVIARPGAARGFLPVSSNVPALAAVCRHRPGTGL